MSGILDMSGNKITNLAYPTESLDSANKKYVDDHVPNVPPKSKFDGWTKIGTITTTGEGTKVFSNMPEFANQFLLSIETNTENSAVYWGGDGGIGVSAVAGSTLICNTYSKSGELVIYGCYLNPSGSSTGYIVAGYPQYIYVSDGTGGRFSLYYR